MEKRGLLAALPSSKTNQNRGSHDMTQARIIKRYANRKLYDTQHSRYVTLEQISEMIRLGDDVKIIDNKTKEDLTSVTLAQIIFEEEKKQRSFLSLQTMRDIIQNGGESFAQFVSEAQRRVTSILPRRKDGDAAVAEAPVTVDAPEAAGQAGAESEAVAQAGGVEGEPAETRKRAREGLAALRELREWVEHSQRTIDEWHRRVDDRIRHMVEGISPFAGVQKDVKALAERMAALETKLDHLAIEPEAHDVPEMIDAAHASAPGTLPGARVDMAPGSRNGIGSVGADGSRAHDTEAQ
ncbi:MAG TPA: polyhydroxyalkanoate synthesis regulator DNA-binding domain-containing protein [Haliangium sp.]|nr:polyhydroxyalkanoate synthesis regulator DNA-binding domain-containing protein [Haliangium sp.]